MPDFKRALDFTVAGAALLLAAPLMGLAALAVRVETPGPALFRQQRVGQGRRSIVTLKIRTMSTAMPGGLEITSRNDRRITRVGQWLRKAKLDELPQLWNVVRGDMSLVGPRPEVARYVDLYRDEWAPLFHVRPGLTDLASIAFRDEEALLAEAHDPERAYREVIMPIKLGLALEGVQNSSVGYDLGILARTLMAIVSGHNPRADVIADVRRRITEINQSSHS